MVHFHDGILCRRRKEGAVAVCGSMDGIGEHYAELSQEMKDKYQMISPVSGT